MTHSKPYRIIGAYDSETTNYEKDGERFAFPVLHQLGILTIPIEQVEPSNVVENVEIELFRHSLELYERLDEIAGTDFDYVPVVLCHNLAFDMYGLSHWFARHDVRVLAKSARKPITFTVLGETGKPSLVIWDTLIFTQQSLERMGVDCGYAKGVGEWDYDLIRTPDTPLTDEEMDYAKRDIYTLLSWFGWWLRRNPEILPERLGLNVVTKTGIVRERRRLRFDHLKGSGQKENVGRYWLYRNRMEAPKSDDELFKMFAATRGAFTFYAMQSASVPYNFDDGRVIAGYDATSQHPAQIVSHKYPVGFREMSVRVLDLAFSVIGKVTLSRVLDMWEKPFPVAFYACFEFANLRPKAGSVFERFGIYPLASARYKSAEQIAQDEDNGDKAAYLEHMYSRNYQDECVNARFAFGKVISADRAKLYLTELSAWEVWQCYEWDDVRAVHGYETGKFMRPSDMDVISVMQFYKAKNEFKIAREEYYGSGTITNGDNLRELGIADAFVQELEGGTASAGDVEAEYLSLKADLNSIFGINASNEYRRTVELTSSGIEYMGEFGICNAPKNPKVWYQFGQRIVGWSRIAQVCVMLLTAPHVYEIVNGDTDSVKLVCDRANLGAVDKALQRLHDGIDKAKAYVISRAKHAYPRYFDSLDEIGHYVREFETDRFCASWNKAYCIHEIGRDGKRRFAFTLAGVPTRRRQSARESFIGVNGLADRMHATGMGFEDICNLFLGYNVTYAHDVIKLNGRKFPTWNTCTFNRITDYLGNVSTVVEPHALTLYPMAKTVNDTKRDENAINCEIALRNNPSVNTSNKLIWSGGVLDLGGIDYAEIL